MERSIPRVKSFAKRIKRIRVWKKKMYVFTEFRMENLVRAFSFIIYDGTLDGDRPSAPRIYNVGI